MISVEELHEFARDKVRDVAPAMQPKIYLAEEGYKIVVAKAPVGDPGLEYRKEAESLANERQGKFSELILTSLERKQKELGLASEVAASIRQEVLRPYEEFAAKRQTYQEALQQQLQPGNRLSKEAWKDLQYFQQTLGLTDANVRPLIAAAKQSSRVEELKRIRTQTGSSIKNLPTPRHLPVSAIVLVLSIGGTGVAWQNLQPRTIPSPPINVPSPGNTPGTAEDLVQKGIEKYNKKDYQGAIDNYDQAIKLKPDYALAYMGRGNARSALDNNKAAIADYNQAIQVNQNWGSVGLWAAYMGRGKVRSDLGDKKAAIADYDQAIKIKFDYAPAYFGRGNARSNLGDNTAAIDDYDQAIKLKPDYATAYMGRGFVRYTLGDKKTAIDDYNQAIKLKPDYAEAYNNRGSTRSDLGDNTAAIDDYNQAIKLKPDYADAYSGRGIVRRALGDNRAAIDDYDQAIKLKPDYALAYYGRAYIRAMLGETPKAIADYQKAVELYPTGNPWRQRALDEIKKLQQ